MKKKINYSKNTGIFKKEGRKKNAKLAKLRDRLSNYLNENIDIVKESVILVFVEEDVDVKQELYKTIDKNGISLQF